MLLQGDLGIFPLRDRVPPRWGTKKKLLMQEWQSRHEQRYDERAPFVVFV